MDPVTELQTRVEWVVTATIDTVQLIATDAKPDAEKVGRCSSHRGAHAVLDGVRLCNRSHPAWNLSKSRSV